MEMVRSTGHGGMNRDHNDTCVRLTHLPTGNHSFRISLFFTFQVLSLKHKRRDMLNRIVLQHKTVYACYCMIKNERVYWPLNKVDENFRCDACCFQLFIYLYFRLVLEVGLRRFAHTTCIKIASPIIVFISHGLVYLTFLLMVRFYYFFCNFHFLL